MVGLWPEAAEDLPMNGAVRMDGHRSKLPFQHKITATCTSPEHQPRDHESSHSAMLMAGRWTQAAAL